MNSWGKEILNKISTGMSGVERPDERTIRTKTSIGTIHQHMWLETEEASLTDQFPEITFCIIRNTAGEKIKKYNLYVKRDYYVSHLISIKFPINNQRRSITCYLSQGSPDDPLVPVESLKAAFSEWLQQLPAYRLYFVTGDWEMEVK